MPKKGEGRIIPAALEVLKDYNNRITIRQLFYRLVSKGVIKNSLGGYQVLIQAMSITRRDGRIPFNAFEDRTRHSFLGEDPQLETESAQIILDVAIDVYEHAKEYALQQMKDAYQSFTLPQWNEQPIYLEVWLEKEALANLFEPVTQQYGVTFVPCRGYASLSLLYDCAERFKRVPENREVRILYFGDYDMRGLNIPETIEKNLLDDFGVSVKVVRYGLTQEQIETYQLPPSPAKSTDTMAKGWIKNNGNVAWELDALEPRILVCLVTEAIKQQIDAEKWNSRIERKQSEAMWIKTQVAEYLASKGVI